MPLRENRELTEDEENDLLQLARRQRESESAEARILAKYANRFAVVRQFWAVLFALGAAIVLTSLYLFTIKADIAECVKELAHLRDEIAAIRTADIAPIRETQRDAEKRIMTIQLELKDKANR